MYTLFVVPGRPVPKGRPRFARGHAFTPQKTLNYEKSVAEASDFPENWPLDADYAVHLEVYYDSNVHGDLDNVAKSVLDGLNGTGEAWDDDKQVAYLSMARRWCSEHGGEPRVVVSITSWPRTYAKGVAPKKQAKRAPAPKKARKPKRVLTKPRTVESRRKT